MPIYPALSFLAVGVVLVVELVFLRTGLLAQRAYWIAMAIVYGFMVLVDGWLTKLSAPIVVYRPDDVSGWRPIWDILAEEYLYAWALLTLVLVCWEHAGRSAAEPADDRADADTSTGAEAGAASEVGAGADTGAEAGR